MFPRSVPASPRLVSTCLVSLCLVGCATGARERSSGPTVADVPTTAAEPQAAPVVPVPKVQADGGIVLRHARLIDGTKRQPQTDVDVLVQGDRIVAIGPGLTAPAGAREIDLGGRTLLPGLIDAHVHLSFTPPKNFETGVTQSVQRSEADYALDGAANAWRTLRAGFTTVRNVGGSMADRALRDAIAKGWVAGPRMLIANHAIGITGGHCDGTNGLHPDVAPHSQDYRSGVADGPDEVRKAVRYQIKHGADLIKICATGGVMSQGDTVGAPQLTPAEMAAIVEEAARAERKVAAHAHGNRGIRDAVAAGVHSIEHGSILDRQTVGMMRSAGTFLVPTLYVGRFVEAAAAKGTLSEESAAKGREIAPKMRESFKLAYDERVKIAMGSDAGVFPHGDNAREFEEMVEHGMSAADAIVAGTSSAAELLGLRDVGTVTPGFVADLVVVGGDPLADISVMREPAMVMKAGVVYVEPTWTEGAPR